VLAGGDVGVKAGCFALAKADEYFKKRDWSLWVHPIKVNPWLLMSAIATTQPQQKG
jgi:hypothetical protein